MRSGDRFDAIMLVVKPPRPDQRANCLRQAVRFALQGEIGEAEFFVARQEEAKGPITWDNTGMRASERLAYRVIYHDNSPLHQLNSITKGRLCEPSVRRLHSMGERQPARWLDHIRRRALNARSA